MYAGEKMKTVKSIDDLSPKDREKLFSLASTFHFGIQESMSLESLTTLSEYGFVEKADKEGYWQGTESLLSFIRAYY